MRQRITRNGSLQKVKLDSIVVPDESQAGMFIELSPAMVGEIGDDFSFTNSDSEGLDDDDKEGVDYGQCDDGNYEQ